MLVLHACVGFSVQEWVPEEREAGSGAVVGSSVLLGFCVGSTLVLLSLLSTFCISNKTDGP